MMSDDDTDLLSRAFPVEVAGEEFNLDIPPTSGQEYLRRVQLEAKKCPSVVVADIDTSSYTEKQTFKVLGTSGLHPAPSGFAPTVKWQREQMSNFSAVRKKFLTHKSQVKKEGQKKKRLPLKNDIQGWCQLCFGPLRPNETRRLPPVVDQESMETADPLSAESQDEGNASSATDQGNNGSRGVPPLLSIVTRMDQPTIIQVLEYHINWFEATGFTTEQGQWFYALLTCLEKPLEPETCSLLRALAKNCANLRASLENSHDLRLAPLNLLICLVARYFDQSDLADCR